MQKAQKLSSDPAEFFEQVVGFKPFPHQEEFIRLFVDAFIRNKHPRFKKEFAASRHQPFGKTSDYVASVKNANLEKMAKLIKIVGMLLQTKVYLFWAVQR